jgi:hypothetical protein
MVPDGRSPRSSSDARFLQGDDDDEAEGAAVGASPGAAAGGDG